MLNLLYHKKVHYPIEVNMKCKKKKGETFGDRTSWFIYRTYYGPPNISYVVQMLSQFVIKSYKMHYIDFLRVIRYIKGNVNPSFLFSLPSSLDIVGYSYADRKGFLDSR